MMHKSALQIRWEDERVIQYFEDKEKEDHEEKLHIFTDTKTNVQVNNLF
jgi:hypothetical protein